MTDKKKPTAPKPTAPKGTPVRKPYKPPVPKRTPVSIQFPDNYREMSWTPDGSQPLLHICSEHLVQMTQYAGKIFCGVCMRDRAERWEKMAEALYNDFANMCIEFGIKPAQSMESYGQQIVDEYKQMRGER